MDWNSLKIFLAVAHSGSLASAASRLGVNHSTVFRRLNALEKDVGGRLFQRRQNRYELTAMGEEVLELARHIEEGFDALDRHVVGKDFQPKGTVKITAPNNISYRFLPRYVAEFNQLYPDIHIELLVSNLEFNMNNRQADIAVRATTSPPPQHLVGRPLARIGWSVYGSPAYAENYTLPARIEELVNHAIIGAAGNLRSLDVFAWQENQFRDQIIARCDDLTAMSYLVETGRGLALLPNDQQRPQITKLLPLDENFDSALWLLTHPDLRNVERIRLVMQHLTRAFALEWPSPNAKE